MSFLEGIRALQEQNAEAVPWQMTGLRRMQALCGIEGEALLDSLVLVQVPAREMDREVWDLVDERGGMDFPVVLEIVPDPKKDVLGLTLHTHLLPLEEEGVREILRGFDGFLTKVLVDPRAQMLDAEVKGEWAARTQERRDHKGRQYRSLDSARGSG
jgi:hypothetical protein